MRSARTLSHNTKLAVGDKREAILRAAISVFAHNGYFNSKVADIAREAGRLDGDPDAALPLYKRVLELQPTRNEALEGREDALSDLLQQAQAALAKRDFAKAASLVESARGYDPGHVGLPDATAALTQARHSCPTASAPCASQY